MRTTCWTVLALAWLTACGGGVTQQLPASTAADVRMSRIAAGFYNLDPRIVYEQHAYRVLWLQTNRQEATFDGIWDVDADLSEAFVDKLDDLVVEVLPLQGDEEFAKELKATLHSQRRPGAEPAQLTLSTKQLTALRGSHVKYLVLMCSGPFRVETHDIGDVAVFFLPTEVIIYDVTSGKQIFSEPVQLAGKVPHRKTVREIEANGMAQLRRISSQSLVERTETYLPQLLRTLPASQ